MIFRRPIGNDVRMARSGGRTRIQPLLLGVGLGTALGVASALRRRRPLSRDSDEGDGFAELTKNELYQLARDAELPGRSAMSKAELIRALRSAS
jgi:hypothetical protein